MTFSRVKSMGYIDDVSVIPAAEINAIDTNQSEAIDGASGGTYTLSSPLVLDGAGVKIGSDGGIGIAELRITGPVTIVGDAATIRWRTQQLSGGSQPVDGSTTDVFLTQSPTGSAITYDLNGSGSNGMMVHFRRPATGTFNITIYDTPNFICTMHQGTGPVSCTLIKLSGAWRLLMFSPDVDPESGA